MKISEAAAALAEALAEEAAAAADPVRHARAIEAVEAARRALTKAEPGTSLDLTAFLLAAE